MSPEIFNVGAFVLVIAGAALIRPLTVRRDWTGRGRRPSQSCRIDRQGTLGDPVFTHKHCGAGNQDASERTIKTLAFGLAVGASEGANRADADGTGRRNHRPKDAWGREVVVL
ncbi:MAG: hypothetical protein OXC63_13710 [Aestuariivita sp.]|nr:hypothetical protein [Aestuariivita sp.]MCY4347192.1 hypothetical protein [Aestuariivita sp.]